MVSILPAIKFKTLIDQLNDNEFDKLLSKFCQRVGREEILRLMWDTLYNSHFNAMEGEILSIMQQRNLKATNPSNPTVTPISSCSIATLPTTMVGEIASYLDQKAYARFSITNRKMFVNCNSPNRLVALNLDRVEDFTFVSLANYRHLTSLEFALVNIDDFDCSLISRCNRLQTLMISAAYRCYTYNLRRFIGKIDGAFTEVTSLALYGFMKLTEQDLNAPLPPGLFAQLLALFPALTHLKLFNIEFTGHLDDALLANRCPSLNRLSLHDAEHDTSFLNAYGAQLTTLTMTPSLAGLAPPNLDYSKLRRLCLYAPSQDAMNALLKTSKNMEEICFVPLMKDEQRNIQAMSTSEITQMTRELIVNLNSIKFIHIWTRGHFDSICDSLHTGLYRTKDRERDFMEIGLTVDCREIADFNNFMCSISRIMVGMVQSETKKWILSLDAHYERSFDMDRDSWEQAVASFMTSYETLNLQLLLSGKWKLVFGSAGCSFMDAHRHWWNDCWKIDFE